MATFSHKGRREGNVDHRVASTLQYLLGFGDNPVNDFGRWRNVVDQPNSFSCDHGGDIKITCSLGRGVFGCNLVHILQQLDLPPHPAPRMIVDQAAPGKRRRPDIVA